MAGPTNVTRREALLASDGQVLPSPWQVLEHVKMSPFATKFHEIMIRNCAPTAATPGSTENG